MPTTAKALAERMLSPRMRRVARNLLEDVRDWIGVSAFGLGFVATHAPPKVLLYFGFSPGDDLLCTAVLREFRKRRTDRVLMVSDHAELFAGNPDPTYVRPLWRRYYRDGSTVAICRRFAQLSGARFFRLEYAPMNGLDRREIPSRHIIAEMCARVGMSGPVSVRPYLELTDAEKASAAWARGRVVIQNGGMAARHPMRNKQWYDVRFQQVVDSLAGEVDFIQLGSATDPTLQHVTDLRGATSIRQTAAILHHARLYVGTVGFPMHLARAVECPSVIIFGGREAPWQSGYICNINLYSAPPCAPCWRSNTCDFDRQCMQDIAAADVVSAIRQMMGRPRNPLDVEIVDIVPDAVTAPTRSRSPE
jgi:hypothetical protein